MKITVRVWGTKLESSVELEVKPSTTLQMIRSMLMERLVAMEFLETGEQPAKLNFYSFCSRFMSLKETVTECGVVDGSIMDVYFERAAAENEGPSGPPKMTIFVKVCNGETMQTIAVQVEPGDKTVKIKEALVPITGAPVDLYRLTFSGRQLCDDKTVEESKLCNEVTVHQVFRLLGDGHNN